MRLGKKEYIPDPRTAKLADFIEDIWFPQSFDFDKRRVAFPLKMWGNDVYGDCVKACQANALLRLERIETYRTISLTNQNVIDEYKRESIREFGSPFQDEGLYIGKSISNWRKVGWPLNAVTYKIQAYGELSPYDPVQLRRALFLLHGIHFGFSLPLAAQEMTDAGVWDYKGQTGSQWQSGSWGGHCVFSKRYDSTGFYVLTWGREIKVTNKFIDKYCDEAWSVVDDFDKYRDTQTFNAAKLLKYLHDIGASNINA